MDTKDMLTDNSHADNSHADDMHTDGMRTDGMREKAVDVESMLGASAIRSIPNASITRRAFMAAGGASAVLAAVPSAVSAATKTQASTPSSSGGAAPGPKPALKGDGILVFLTLYGGNDGLDTVIPFADPAYQASRSGLAFQAADVLPLRDGVGLHPSMKRIHAMFRAGQASIVQGVGYPNPNRSHFRSMDIWHSAVPDRQEVTGFLGRWHDLTGPDPLRMVNVGSSVPRALIGMKGGPASVPNGRVAVPAGLVNGYSKMSQLGPELGVLGSRIAASGVDLLRVRDKFGPILKGAPTASVNLEGGAVADGYATRSPLDDQLDTVASVVFSGAPTRVFAVSLGGFDTHAQEKGTHARLLAAVDGAVGRFYDKFAGKPEGNKIVVMMQSEFGRRVNANLSEGTDHGTAAPMFVIGPAVNGGLVGDHPSLTKLDNGDLIYTVDFREVYGAVLGTVLGVDPTSVIPTVPTGGLKERLF